jgi:predicted ATPase/DNA-binding SARP family transcriptional activator
MSEISLSWLGPIVATIDGRPIKFRTRKAQALLMYLTTEAALQGGAPTRRETLLGLLWPDYTERSARQSLRTNLSYLKKALAGMEEGEGENNTSFLLSDSRIVQVNPAVPFDLDVATFSQLLGECGAHEHENVVGCAECHLRLERAAGYYRGDFLADFYLPDSSEFEAWVSARREAQRRQMLDALEALTGGCMASAEFEAAETYARRQLEIDPLRERAHQQLMEILAHMGRRPAALHQYEIFQTSLQEEMDAEPSAETQALFESIRGGDLGKVTPERGKSEVTSRAPVKVVAPELPAKQPRIAHNLPAQPTPFIGREEELAALDKLIADPEVRLVTIVGPGGMGKTRLALAAAERWTSAAGGNGTRSYRFADGVYFLSEQDQIVPTIAETLGIQLQSGALTPKQHLLAYLREKRLLLVLDNFGHLLEGVEMLGDLVQSTQQVQILATSRERLHLVGEQVFAIQGLEVVELEAEGIPADVDDAVSYPAAQLFLQSARKVQHDFDVTAEEAPQLTRICRLVEGMPLGVELAATWVDTLSLADIAAEIQNGLDFLETEWRHVPQRHRSMRAAIDSSWRRLSQVEREAFSQLSVFRGGFTRQAAQEVSGATLRVLANLVGKSFLQFDKTGNRYQVHKLLRQYGTEKLAEAPEQQEDTRNRHAATYMAFLAKQEPRLKGAEMKGAMEAIRADIDNIRRAWRRVGAEAQDEQMKLGEFSLFLFYQFRGWYPEGEEAFRQAVSVLESRCPDEESGDRLTASCYLLAQALDHQGYFLVRMGRSEQALKALDKSLRIFRQAPDEAKWETAHCLIHYGGIFHTAGQYGQALPHYQESEALFRETGDAWGWALSLGESAQIHHLLGRYEEGRRLYREAQTLYERIGERRFLVFVVSNLARIAFIQGAYEEAEAGHQQCLKLREEMGDLSGVAFTLTDLADLARTQGNYAKAERLYRRALELAKEIALSSGELLALEGLSKLANSQAEYEQARKWQQAGLALAKAADIRPWEFQLEYGWTDLAQGETQPARRSFLAALKMTHERQIAPGALASVAGLAALAAEEGDKEKAIEWLALSSSHPAGYADEKERYRQQMAGVSAGMTPAAVVVAEERGLARELWETVEELLEQLGDSS